MIRLEIIRCEKNETRCPLTSCFNSLNETKEGFSGYEAVSLIGSFTCRCPGGEIPLKRWPKF